MSENTENRSSGTIRDAERRADIPCMARDVASRWWLAVIAALVAAMVAYTVSTVIYKPEYTSYANLAVYSTESGSTTYSAATVAENMAAAFSSVVNSSAMKKLVSSTIDYSYSDSQVEAAVIEGTNLIKVSATSGNPVDSYRLLNAILDNHSVLTAQIMENAGVEVLKAPQVSETTSNSMNRGRITAIAAAAAFLAVVVIEVYLSYSSDTVKNREEFPSMVDAPLLGVIVHEKKYKTFVQMLKKKKVSIIATDPHLSFEVLESFKKLRTKIEYKANAKSCRSIMVTSVLENEGKTTVAVNIAMSLSQKGYNVALIDADTRRPAVHKTMSVGEYKYSLISVLNGEVEPQNALLRDKSSGLYMLPCKEGAGNAVSSIFAAGLKNCISELLQVMDYVVVDTMPMSVSADAEILADICDASVLVVRQNYTDVRDINDAADTLNSANGEFFGCVFNNVYESAGVLRGHYGSRGYYGGYYSGYYGRYGKYGNYYDSREKTVEPSRHDENATGPAGKGGRA